MSARSESPVEATDLAPPLSGGEEDIKQFEDTQRYVGMFLLLVGAGAAVQVIGVLLELGPVFALAMALMILVLVLPFAAHWWSIEKHRKQLKVEMQEDEVRRLHAHIRACLDRDQGGEVAASALPEGGESELSGDIARNEVRHPEAERTT